MGLGQKINNILEYKISVDLDAKLSRKKALWIIGAVTVIIFTLGYIIGETMFWGEDSRSVFDRQIDVLEQASEKPDNIRSKVDLALAYYLKGETTQAGDLFEEIISKDKDNATANIYYGMILADQKQYRDALPYLLKGIEKDPRQEKLAYLYTGISYYHLGGFEQARTHLEKATKIDPGSSVGYYYLGVSYKKLGNTNNARKALEKAIVLSGNNYPEAVKELKELPGK